MYNTVIEDIDKCYGCTACVSACPKDCMIISQDEYGFRKVEMGSYDKCISCELCKKVCPRCNKVESSSRKIMRYYAQNRDEDVLLESSSGGAFSAIAKVFLDRNGLVWGVAMKSDGTTEFCCVTSYGDLDKLRGSKYVEVCKPIPFEQIKKQLDSGKLVMFAGTPCQVQALYYYLHKKRYENLFLVDLLCYGIQSPFMWNQYLKEVNPENLPIIDISMRRKFPSWESYSMELKFADGSKYRKSRWSDPYLLTYSTNIFNRPSCSNCLAKSFPRISDLTIGDFWQIDGMKKIPRDIQINKGVSLILSHSEYGEKVLEDSRECLVLHEIEDEVMPHLLSSLAKLSKTRKDRSAFKACVEDKGFETAVKTFTSSTKKKQLRFMWLNFKRKARLLLDR